MNEAIDRGWVIAYIIERIMARNRIVSCSSSPKELRSALEVKTDEQLRKICYCLAGLP